MACLCGKVSFVLGLGYNDFSESCVICLGFWFPLMSILLSFSIPFAGNGNTIPKMSSLLSHWTVRWCCQKSGVLSFSPSPSLSPPSSPSLWRYVRTTGLICCTARTSQSQKLLPQQLASSKTLMCRRHNLGMENHHHHSISHLSD